MNISGMSFARAAFLQTKNGVNFTNANKFLLPIAQKSFFCHIPLSKSQGLNNRVKLNKNVISPFTAQKISFASTCTLSRSSHTVVNPEWTDYVDEHGQRIPTKDMVKYVDIMTLAEAASCIEFSSRLSALIKEGADVNEHDSDSGFTAMMIAAHNGSVEVIKILFDGGGDVNKGGIFRLKPIHLAAEGGVLDIVKFLHGKGADLFAKDIFGKTALDKAKSRGHSQIVEYLEQQPKPVNGSHASNANDAPKWIVNC